MTTRIKDILDRAATDIAFREQLMQNPHQALADLNLTKEEVELIAPLRRVPLEEAGIDVRKARAFLRDNGAKKWLSADGR